jgi:hypothetical protein
MDGTSEPDAAAIANGAAEAIRALNHLTLPADRWPGLTYPSDAYRTLGALSMLADRLPQALEQIAGYLVREQYWDHIAIEGGEYADDPIAAVSTAARLLHGRASRSAHRLAAALDHAQQAIAFASYTGPEVEAKSP